MTVLDPIQAILLPVGSAVLALAALLPLRERTRRYAGTVLTTGMAIVTFGIAARWVVTGHPPIFGTFENSLAATWFVGAMVLLLGRPGFSRRVPQALGRRLSLWMLPLLALGQFANRTPYPLTISERSLVVDLHVLFSWSSQTVLLIAATAAIVVVVRRETADAQGWSDIMTRGAGIGFALLTIMMVVGSLYSYLLFSEWFRWEITEAFAAAAWLSYGATIHASMLFGWKGRRLAICVLLSSVLMLATFWSWNFWPNTYHHFDIPEIRAE